MTDILSIQEVRGQVSGALIGFELTTHPGGEKLLVWADQKGMPGFRIGDGFVPGYGEKLEMGKRTVLRVDA
jgi:hypothetical protein